MQTSKLLLHLIKYRPWLFWINCLGIILLFMAEMIPGLVAREVFDRLAALDGRDIGLWWLVALLVMSALWRIVCLIVCQLTNAPFMLTSAGLLQKNLLNRVLELPAAKALPSSAGEAISRFRDDVDGVTNSLITLNDLIATAIFAVVALVIMVSINPLITLGVFLPLTIVVAVVNLAAKRIDAYQRATREATGRVTGFLAEVLGAVQAVQVAGADDQVARHFRELNDRRLDVAVRDRVFDQVLQSIFWNTVNVGTGLILLFSGQAMSNGSFTVGDFALFVYYLGWITEFTAMFGVVLAQYRRSTVSFSRMTVLLAGKPTEAVVEHTPLYLDGKRPPLPGIPAAQAGKLNSLEVRELSYNYPDSDKGIHDVSFAIQRGSFTVVTGRIGAGKTTLLQTLLGLSPKDSGEILWNGKAVTDPANFFVPPQSAYTPQVPRLFSETLRNNIMLGLPENELDLPGALRLAVMEDDLAAMPKGLDTEVGPKGVRLSGGQIQRSAAARMFVRPAELLVFDDLSSALDVETENTLWERVFAHKDCTVLAVSHRRPALRRADCIIVMKNGRVEAIGKLDDLMQSCPEMVALWHGEIAAEQRETQPEPVLV